jgi:putative ABC transport system permease protein
VERVPLSAALHVTSLRRFLRRLAAPFRSSQAEHDLAREIRSHLQLLEDRFRAQGMSPEEARFAAQRAFGGVEQAKEHQRDARSFRWIDDSRTDVKLGARMLLKYPGLSLVGGVGLAVGIAVGAAFFAFFYAYIYATIPAPDGHRIVGLENWDIRTNNEMRQSAHDFVRWRDEMKTVQELGAFRTIGRNLVVPGASPEPIRVAEITAVGLGVPHIQPRLGRALIPADEQPGARPVLVIGGDVWAARFNSDPSVLGRDVRLGNIVHTIVGVMPEGFEFPINHSYWTPLRIEPSQYPRRQGPTIFIFGRLAPGVMIAQAQAELTTIASMASTLFPDTHTDLRARVMPYAHPILDIQGITSWQFATLQFIVSLLLLIIALNVAILIYARTATRQGEIAVRTALGASRGRLVAQLFIEALVLCGTAAGAGLLLAQVGIRMGHAIMETEVGKLPYFIDAGIPAPAYAYIALLTLVAAVIAGVVPALHSTGRRMQTTLKEFGSSSGLRLGGTWTTLIVAQVALAVFGLPLAVAAFWGEISAATTTLAFEPRPYLAATLAGETEPPPGVDPETYRADAAARIAKLRSDLVALVEAEALVEDVTLARGMPGDEPAAQVEIEGTATPASSAPTVRFNEVSSDFFAAFGIPLITGRMLASADAASAARPVVVNQAFVRQVLGNRDAIGRRIRYSAGRQDGLALGESPENPFVAGVKTGHWHEIVGVVGDLYTNPIDPELVRPGVFHALDTVSDSRPRLLIKVRGDDATNYSTRLREIVMSLDPSLRLNLWPFIEVDRQRQLALRLVILALTLIVISVLLLSAAGIYALMSFTVSRRRKEIGIRAALGADTGQLLRGIFTRAAAQLGSGVVLGAALALLADLLSGGETLGPAGRLLFVPAIATVMVGVGLAASIGPARRGLRIQPTEALRDQ